MCISVDSIHRREPPCPPNTTSDRRLPLWSWRSVWLRLMRSVARCAGSRFGAVASGVLDDFTSDWRTLDEKRFPFPADVFTELAADAMGLAGVTRSEPVSLDDFAERYLPEFEFRGNTAHQKMRAAINLVVGVHGGVVAGLFRCRGLMAAPGSVVVRVRDARVDGASRGRTDGSAGRRCLFRAGRGSWHRRVTRPASRTGAVV